MFRKDRKLTGKCSVITDEYLAQLCIFNHNNGVTKTLTGFCLWLGGVLLEHLYSYIFIIL